MERIINNIILKYESGIYNIQDIEKMCIKHPFVTKYIKLIKNGDKKIIKNKSYILQQNEEEIVFTQNVSDKERIELLEQALLDLLLRGDTDV